MASLNIEYFFLKIYNFFTSSHSLADSTGFMKFKHALIVILSLVAIIFITVIIYSLIRLHERSEADKKSYKESIRALHERKEEKKGATRWQTILELIASRSPSDWRVAVLEADKMLDDLTREKGFSGENLGERLKNAPATHFRTLDSAWEAHKIRNLIAHEGGYDLTYKDAKRAVEMFEEVFEEFGYI